LRLLRWWSPRSPGPLVAVIIGTLLCFLFNLESFGISLVDKISAVLPTLALHMPKGIELDDLLLEGFGILIVSFGSGIVTARIGPEMSFTRIEDAALAFRKAD
jgi:sulfate permease, SulP family